MSSWETSSGRPTDYTGTVEEMIFGYDSRIKGGEELIGIFKIKPDDGDDVETDEEGYVVENFTLGKGWKSLDGGETAEGNKKFNKNTMYGRLIDHCIKELGSVDNAIAFFDGDTTEAKIWVGTHATWSEVDFPYPDKDNPGEMKHFTMNLPHEITKAGAGAGSGTAAKKAASGAAKKATGKASNGAGDIEGRLRKLAAAFDDHGDWLEQAMKIDGVADDDTWVAKLGDEDYYASLKG